MRAGAAEARSPGTGGHRRALWQRWPGAGPARGWRSQRELCPGWGTFRASSPTARAPQGPHVGHGQHLRDPGAGSGSGPAPTARPEAHAGCATNELCFPARAKNGRLESAGQIQPPLTKIFQYFPAITALERISRIILNSRKGISQGNGRGGCLLFPLIAQGRLHTQGHLPALSFLGVVAAAPSNNVSVTINPFMSPFLPGIAGQFFGFCFFFFFPLPFAPDFCPMPSGYCLLDKTSNPIPDRSRSLKIPWQFWGRLQFG